VFKNDIFQKFGKNDLMFGPIGLFFISIVILKVSNWLLLGLIVTCRVNLGTIERLFGVFWMILSRSHGWKKISSQILGRGVL